MSSMAVWPILCLVPLAAAHADLSWDSPQFHGSGRKLLWDEAAGHNHIWGRCTRWDANVSGCEFHSHRCNDFLSDGPPDADIEVTLSNVTASKPGSEVHLHWWAPRKSPTAWNPLVSPIGCAVYHKMNDAYPLFNATHFNGGNARVNENGEVTIRFQTPATYFVTRWISVPHVHLRVCSSDSYAHTTQDAIVFTNKGIELVGGEEGSTMHLKRKTNLTAFTDAPGSGTVTGAEVAGTLVFKEEGPAETSTTLNPISDDGRQKIIDDAKDRMNLDALEFSPVYQCFERGQFFDHFSGDCADDCSDSNDLAHGQCVRAESETEATTISATWELRATCNTKCWETWKNVTLHNARLALAGQLDIPFQEVVKSALVFQGEDSGGRRLSGERRGLLQLQVSTKRLNPTAAESRILTFLPSEAETGKIFNFAVSDVSRAGIDTTGAWKEMTNGNRVVTDYMSNDNDPYQSAYTQNQPQRSRGGVQSIGGIPVSGLPPEVIIIIAVVVVVTGALFGFYLWYRRKKMLAAGATMTASGTVVGATMQNPEGKTVDDYDYPTKPGQAQAEDYPTKPAQANP